MSERVLIVGGNAAGMTAASRAKRLDASLFVHVLEAGPRIAYSICGLPYALAGVVGHIDDLVLFTPESLKNERGVDATLSHNVTEIVPSRRAVVVEDTSTGDRKSLPYDKLVLATGYRPRRLRVEGGELKGVFTASRLSDGEAIRDWLHETQARRAVLVGAGYVGLEMAESLTKRGLEVTLVEADAQVFPSLDPDMAALVEAELERRAVRVLTSRQVKRIVGNRGSVEAVELTKGSLRLSAEVVFVDIGVEPSVELASAASITLGPSGAIAVDDHMETSQHGVYAAGNCVETLHLVSGRPTPIPLGTVAVKQGRVAGENVAGRRTRFRGAVGTSIVKVFGLVAARTGLSSREARAAGFSTVEATIGGRFQAHYFGDGAPATVKVIAEQGSGRLLGGQIVGSAEGAMGIDVLATVLTAGMSVSEASQLDLAYAPPVGALWNPLLVAMNQVKKKV